MQSGVFSTTNKTHAHTEDKFGDRMRGDQELQEEDPVG